MGYLFKEKNMEGHIEEFKEHEKPEKKTEQEK